MRTIKFRAWDIDNEVFLKTTEILIRAFNGATLRWDKSLLFNVEIQQFTGLLDKNGKEIYEGDIILTQECHNGYSGKRRKYKQHYGVVEYKIEKGKFHCGDELVERDISAYWNVKINNVGDFMCHNWSLLWNCEVIGNIFENPDLLTSHKA